MKKLNEKIKKLRTQLNLSQEYVANYLGVNRTTFTQMENGNRKIAADELAKLSILFGVSADYLLNDSNISQPAVMFARSFENLDETDQAEIMNLIHFKEQIKAQRQNNTNAL
ncbi:helix-turn-helix transcriptional regulator [bacterium]|nr:helix-turn-helix transcriptional regulator [bacterium]